MKKTLGLAASALLAFSLTACGGDSDSAGGDYCDQLKDARNSIENADIENLDQAKFDELTALMKDLEDAAPSEVEQEWADVNATFDEIDALFEEAGLSFDDLAQLQNGTIPEGVDPQKLTELAPKFEAIGEDTQDIQGKLDAIEKDAEERCDITFDDNTN